MGAGVAVGLLTGAIMGAITGGLVSLGKMPSFIASLGMMGVGGALSLALAKSTAIYVNNPIFSFFGERLDRSIEWPLMQYFSVPAFIAVTVFSGVWIMLYHTPFGRYIIAIGGNESGARLSGINTVHCKWMVYVVAAVLAAISGITLAARLEAADSIVGVGWEFDAIAATILGGTSFAKGKGGIAGTVLGVLVIGVLPKRTERDRSSIALAAGADGHDHHSRDRVRDHPVTLEGTQEMGVAKADRTETCPEP